MIAARQIFLGRGGGGGGWVNPYVTDGLVAMWDGEWNAGGGVHDATETVWKDLVGGYEASVPNGLDGISWSDKYASIPKYTYMTTPTDPFSSTLADITVQSVSCFYNPSLNTYGQDYEYVNLKSDGTIVYVFWAGNSARFCVGGRARGNSGGGLSQWGEPLSLWNTVYSVSFTIIGNKINFYNGETGIGNQNTSGAAISSLSQNSTMELFRAGNPRVERRIYSMRFYSRALTAAEIAANYAVDKARFNLP